MFTRLIGCLLFLTLGPLCLSSIALAVEDDEDDLQTRIEQKRDSAEAARRRAAAQIVKDTNERIQELETRLTEARKWTKAQFELGERDVIDKPKIMTPILARWQKARELQIYQFLQHRDKSAGAIESGRALNVLLERVAAAAYEHSQTRKINPEYAIQLYEPTAARQVNDGILSHLIYEERTLGAKRTGRFSQAPIDIVWPSVLREERWTEHRQKIEEARTLALAELESTSGLSTNAESRMRNAIADLNREFAEYRIEWVKSPAEAGKSRALEYRRICDGRRHIERLIGSVYQVLESSGQSVPVERFEGGNIEDLLAYMHTSNLRFAPATGTDRSAYHQVFEMMVRYYLDVKAAAQLEERLENEIGYLKERNQEATDAALGKTLSASDQAAVTIAEFKFLAEVFDDD